MSRTPKTVDFDEVVPKTKQTIIDAMQHICITLLYILTHPGSFKFPPRYKFSVFCGPLASLANFRFSISQSPENYTMYRVRLAHDHSSIMQVQFLDLQDGSSLEGHFQFAVNCHLGCRTGLQMSGRPHLITNSYLPIDWWLQVIVTNYILKCFLCLATVRYFLFYFLQPKQFFLYEQFLIIFRKFPLHRKKNDIKLFEI